MCVQIRKDYYDENIKAGPQSRILEGVTWEEAQKIRVCDLSSVVVNILIVFIKKCKGMLIFDTSVDVGADHGFSALSSLLWLCVAF